MRRASDGRGFVGVALSSVNIATAYRHADLFGNVRRAGSRRRSRGASRAGQWGVARSHAPYGEEAAEPGGSALQEFGHALGREAREDRHEFNVGRADHPRVARQIEQFVLPWPLRCTDRRSDDPDRAAIVGVIHDRAKRPGGQVGCRLGSPHRSGRWQQPHQLSCGRRASAHPRREELVRSLVLQRGEAIDLAARRVIALQLALGVCGSSRSYDTFGRTNAGSVSGACGHECGALCCQIGKPFIELVTASEWDVRADAHGRNIRAPSVRDVLRKQRPPTAFARMWRGGAIALTVARRFGRAHLRRMAPRPQSAKSRHPTGCRRAVPQGRCAAAPAPAARSSASVRSRRSAVAVAGRSSSS